MAPLNRIADNRFVESSVMTGAESLKYAAYVNQSVNGINFLRLEVIIVNVNYVKWLYGNL